MIICINRRRAFTLIEMMIVLAIFSILAAIALPTVKNLLSDQKISRGARGLATFIDIARNRAIAENRQIGVLIERLDNTPATFGSAASIRVRQLTGVPVYSGDAANATGSLMQNAAGTQILVAFDPSDCQLLTLSASLVGTPGVVAPIRTGDMFELPGGQLLPLTLTLRPLTDMNDVVISLDPTDGDGTSARFPSALTSTSFTSLPVAPATPSVADGVPVKFKIHRRPVPSSTAIFSLPRGIAIDLNYSGVGVSGNGFAATAAVATDISIVFASDGSIASVTGQPGAANGPPVGNIFLCLGGLDGVRPDHLFSIQDKAVSNLMNLDSIWLVMNSNTGRTVSAPFASVTAANSPSNAASVAVADPYDATYPLGGALSDARTIANLSDTVDIE